jgi:fructose-1,6-bisphosphatase/inositol monophosphatase family enzyme
MRVAARVGGRGSGAGAAIDAIVARRVRRDRPPVLARGIGTLAGMQPEDQRRLLVRLGAALRDIVLANRDAGGVLHTVEGRSVADTIYAIDRAPDDALIGWFEREWPDVEIVSESLDEPVVVGTPEWTVIVDTVDGTRGLMYDKRPAWSLAAVAPVGGRSGDIVATAMTEIPVTKQWASDVLSATRGGGVTGERVDVRSGGAAPLVVTPSAATDLEHAWASFAKFLPHGKALVAQFEERLWAELYAGAPPADLAIFDDQYLATGGQLAELTCGRDRMVGDVRPLAYAALGLDASMSCHPYDICTALVLEEAGGVVTDPWGAPLDLPLDTTTPVSWVGYANRALADRIGPAVHAAVDEIFPTPAA